MSSDAVRVCRVVMLLSFVLLPCCMVAQRSAIVAFWNVENFFDTYDDTLTLDDAFTPFGDNHWSKRRYSAKRNTIAKTIVAMGAPVIVGLAEVENAAVVADLCQGTPLRKLHYAYLHFDSPDRRGVDCALLYKKERFRVLECRAVCMSVPEAEYYTRDVLLAVGLLDGVDTVAVLVNHWPSQLGGDVAARHRDRIRNRVGELCDSLARHCSLVLVMGDFNNQLAPGRGDGSYKYQGAWNWIDQIFLVGHGTRLDYASCGADTRAFDADWLLDADPRYLGKKPRRSFAGPRYLGGVSDHLPVFRNIYLP